MSKIIVRKQEYANNGTHADEIKAVVRDDLVVNTLSSATDLVPSVGLVKSETDAIKDALSTKQNAVTTGSITATTDTYGMIDSGIAVTSNTIISAITTSVSGYGVIPVRKNSNWYFTIIAVSAASDKPVIAVPGVQFTVFYVMI